jgi:malonate-semialdehyde dehydrogenase (acetylating)/methylmalonate-semialdehyde dehydrogenase
MGAKNHAIVMPDADRDDAVNALVSATFGATGQRCMALSVAVLVGDAKGWVPDIVAAAKKLKLGPGNKEGVDISPLAYKELHERVHHLVSTVEKEGGRLLLDGRNAKVDGYPNGYWFGPTVIDNVQNH